MIFNVIYMLICGSHDISEFHTHDILVVECYYIIVLAKAGECDISAAIAHDTAGQKNEFDQTTK